MIVRSKKSQPRVDTRWGVDTVAEDRVYKSKEDAKAAVAAFVKQGSHVCTNAYPCRYGDEFLVVVVHEVKS